MASLCSKYYCVVVIFINSVDSCVKAEKDKRDLNEVLEALKNKLLDNIDSTAAQQEAPSGLEAPSPLEAMSPRNSQCSSPLQLVGKNINAAEKSEAVIRKAKYTGNVKLLTSGSQTSHEAPLVEDVVPVSKRLRSQKNSKERIIYLVENEQNISLEQNPPDPVDDQNSEDYDVVVEDNPVQKHECKECQVSFSKKGNLTRHIKLVHLKIVEHHEKRKCKYCQASFSYTNIATHINEAHLNIRKFPCELCGHAFAAKRNLQKHVNNNVCKRK